MADAEEYNSNPEGATWDDDVEADPPGCIVRDDTANEWAQSESHALNPTTDGAEDWTILQ